MKRSHLSIPVDQVRKIVELYKGGMNETEIAREMVLSRNTVHKYLVTTGTKTVDPEVSARTSKRLSNKEIRLIIDMYKQGVEVERIADELGISKPVVFRHVRKLGLTRRASKDLVDIAIKQYLNGDQPLDLILKQVRLSKSTFYRHFNRYKETDEYKEKYEQ